MNEPVQYPELEKCLAALRASDAAAQAPAEIEVKLRDAFRNLHNTRKRPVRMWWISGAVAACLALTLGVRFWLEPGVSSPKTVVSAPVAKAPLIAESLPKVEAAKVEAQTAPLRAKPKPRRVRTQLAKVPPESRERSFIPLPYTPVMTQYDRGQVIRVNMPRSTIRTFGLPVNEDRFFEKVQADVLMGEDGIARAIRFVSNSTTR